MTEDTWDELWEDIDWDRVTTIPFITERIHKIKAEGDKLKEKADRLDELLVIYKRHYGNVIEYALELQEKAEKLDTAFKTRDAAIHRMVIAEDKLKAIRNAFPILKSYINIGDKTGISSAIEVIDEILEAEA